MDKIYSRRRIKVPKCIVDFNNGSNKDKKKIKKLIKIIIILVISIFTAYYLINSINPIFKALCETEAKSLATIVLNERSREIISNYNYQDISIIVKDNDGNITAVKSDVVIMNKIVSEIVIKVQQDLNDKDTSNVYLNLGNVTGNKFLSGVGPKIRIPVRNVGRIETEFKSEFYHAGINQTLHRVYLDIKCKISILTPFETIEKEVINQIIIAENIIVGDIPNSYYNLEGLENKRDIMEVIE